MAVQSVEMRGLLAWNDLSQFARSLGAAPTFLFEAKSEAKPEVGRKAQAVRRRTSRLEGGGGGRAFWIGQKEPQK